MRWGVVGAMALPALVPGAHAQTPAQPAPTAPRASEPSGQPPGYAAADAGYKAYSSGDYAQAAARAREAVALAPGNADYQLLLMQALQRTGRTDEAEQAATAALALRPGDPQILAERGYLRQRNGNGPGAREDFAAALRSGTLPPALEMTLLAELGRMDEARQRYAQVRAGGGLAGMSDLDQAYLAVRVGDDQTAREAFARADRAGKLAGPALPDAAYAAMRAGHDDDAVVYLRLSVDAAAAGQWQVSPQGLFETRRAVSELSRRWGVLASVNYRGGGGIVPGFASAAGTIGTKSWQVGTEAYWRPFQRNARYVELFARAFQTLETETGAIGPASRQTGLGLRVKPLTEQNLAFSVSRTEVRGGPDDWLLQAGYTRDWGSDIRQDTTSWWTTRLGAEIGRYTHSRQSYGVGAVQVGHSTRVGAADTPVVLYPHAVVVAEYDSTQRENLSVSAGPGVSARYWFRGDRYAAPRSYVDVTLQYRARAGGDRRTQGWFFTTLLSY